MYSGKSIIALIPARGGSKGLPGKNLLPLLGVPLLGWPIKAAQDSKYVDKIIVSTDDPEIANVGRALGAHVPFLRPPELATDKATSISVIEHAIEYLNNKGENFDYFLLLEPTSPLTQPEDIDKAVEVLFQKRSVADSIVGVSQVHSAHPAFDVVLDSNGLIKPYEGKDFSSAGRRQDLPEVFFFEGSLYLSDLEILLQRKSFYHDRTLPFIVPKWKSFEIDDLVDWVCVEAILKNLPKIQARINTTHEKGGKK
ncbi:MAG: acylneuraminate cytidylyltransferase family protein [Candidatus Riflebacteria bacterium]|nr:acylneuraminate cytidylyltransferase family protein [Candidatus Riflebacteria bacterium]